MARVGRPGAWDGARADAGRPDVPAVVTFFGLYGPSGTLPVGYTEAVMRAAVGPGDPAAREALRDWLDLFNHRFGLLLYAGWEKYRFPVGFARYARLRARADGPPPAPDWFTRAVLSLVGLGAPSARGRVRVEPPAPPGAPRPAPLARGDDLALLHDAGLFALRRPTAAGLAAILADDFGVGVTVDELVGQWLVLGPGAGTRSPGSGCGTRGAGSG